MTKAAQEADIREGLCPQRGALSGQYHNDRIMCPVCGRHFNIKNEQWIAQRRLPRHKPLRSNHEERRTQSRNQ